ncbi:MAG: hypothetical protein COW85_07580 [Ignavibacteria bacterium CG22_combo_CG10-13_8_21_14_all_37_15]|nr:MAG: hypothetical protein COW85_07580 [Ignavibacteria bacterium CG22_combo_CG10-13_8_21_14_all_37_15]
MKKHILIILIVLSNFTLYPQNEMRIVGKGESLSGEQLIDKSVRDANGETCAGLIISSDLDGLSYDSYNGIVKTNSKPGEDFLFLSRDERVVTIYKSGYTSLKIILNDYGIKLNKGEVWKLKVTGDKTTDLIPISIVVKPSDANIFIDEKPKGSAPSQQVSPGEHQLRIEKEGYKAITEKINVSVSNILFSYALQQVDPVAVQINSTPNGAKIFLGGMEKGETPKGWFQFPGTNLLKVTKAGYLDVEQTIAIKENEKNVFNFTLTKNSGVFSFNVTPTDAVVTIDDKIITERSVELKPGTYSIKISKQNYFVLEDTITVKLGDKPNKNYTLTKNTGGLKLSINPPDAKVLINNEITNASGTIELSPGRYKIEIQKENYYSVVETIEIPLNKILEKQYAMQGKVGNLQFSVTPFEATATLSRNGKQIKTWTGLNFEKNLIIGEYELIVKSNGFKTFSKKVKIEEYKIVTEDVKLEVGSDVWKYGEQLIYSGKTYNTVSIKKQILVVFIGYQCWLKENLDVGAMIQGTATPSNNGTIEKYCYNNDSTNCDTYGGLYQWKEAMQYVTTEKAKGICPIGWHIPTKAEFETLLDGVGSSSNSLKAIGQGTASGAGTNASGFSILFAGDQTKLGRFNSLGNSTDLWSSTKSSSGSAYNLYMSYDDNKVNLFNLVHENAFSIRCLQD